MTQEKPQTYVPAPFRGGWSRIPVSSGRALKHAAVAIAPAAAYLRRSGAAMLVVHFLHARGGRTRCDATVWHADGAGYRLDRHSDLDAPSVLGEIGGALSELAKEIGARWPANAQPRAIGFALDGRSIAFNASHPSADGCEWLDEHLRGRAPATLIHDGGAPGLLSQLCPKV